MTEQRKTSNQAWLILKNVLMFGLAALVAAFVVHLAKTKVIPRYFPALAEQAEAKS